MRYGASVMLVVALCMTGCQTTTWPWQRSTPAPVTEPSPLDTSDPSANTYDSPIVPEPGLALSSEQRFSDVPLPVGMKAIPRESYIYESSNLQVGRMVYKSRASVNELAQFYINETPMANWQFQHITQAQDGAELLFTKPDRTLKIGIKNRGFLRGRQLTLNLTPDRS